MEYTKPYLPAGRMKLVINTIAGVMTLLVLICSMQAAFAQTQGLMPAAEVAGKFRSLLNNRPSVPASPQLQRIRTDSVLVEKGYIWSEPGEKVPLLIYKPLQGAGPFPVIICLHGTGSDKEQKDIRNFLYRFSRMGIMAVAIDARYHGERVKGGASKSKEYVDAITRAWKNTDKSKQQYPFFYDTVYDIWRVTDYLVSRSDVQASRIGMMGISMGGIETWMAASVDKRIKVAVPIIAAQSFRWSLENNRWQGRARTIWAAHQQAAKDLGDTAVNAANVKALWQKLLPGITDEFDCPSMVRLFAPRPLLLLSNEKDQNCPLGGAELAFAEATRAYQAASAADKLNIHVSPGEPHRLTPQHVELTLAWFARWL